MKQTSRILTVIVMLLSSVVSMAEVVIATPQNGTIVATEPDANGVVTLTVTPAEGYYIRMSDITVQKTVDPSVLAARSMVPVAQALTLSGDDPAALSAERQYTFTLPSGYGAYVTATFTKCTTPSLSDSIEGWKYGEEANTPQVSGNVGNADVTYTYATKGSNEFSATVPTAAGNYTVKASVPAVGIYTAAEATDDFTIAEYTETISFAADQQWKGYCSKKSLSLTEEGVKAYIITALSATEATATEVDFIPKDVPVLLNRTATEAAEYTATLYSGGETAPTTNLLKVSETAKEVSAAKIYVLYNNEFVLASAGTLPAGHVYLETNGSGSSARQIVISESTGMYDVPRTMHNLDGAWYDLQGHRISGKPAARGIYIHNDKKVVVYE